MTTENDCSKVSPTAKLVAYPRRFSGIQYAAQISDLIRAESAAREILGDNLDKDIPFLATLTEVRYKAQDREVTKLGVKNILELAAGILPRGLIFSSVIGNKYVASDLPEMIGENERICRALVGESGINSRTGLSFAPVDVLDYGQIERAISVFNGEPFAVMCEGLHMYFDDNEKLSISRNINRACRLHNGVWVTTDFVNKESVAKAYQDFSEEYRAIRSETHRRVNRITGRPINFFVSEEVAKKHAKDAGFGCQMSPFYDGSYQIHCLEELGVEPGLKGKLENFMTKTNVAVLTPSD